MADELIVEDEEFLDEQPPDDLTADEPEPEPARKPSYDPKQIEEMLESSRRTEESLKSLQREIRERESADQFWRNRQPQTQETKPEPKKKPEPDEFMEQLSTSGVDALAGHFATPDDVKTLVRQAVAEDRLSQKHAKLLDEHPDLKDAKSDFSRRVSEIVEQDYSGIVKDQDSLLLATERASRRVAEEMKRSGEDRRERTTSAGANRNSYMGSGGSASGAKPVVLTRTQREFARMANVSEKDYLEVYKNNLKERGRR